jgi:hypothetical protein
VIRLSVRGAIRRLLRVWRDQAHPGTAKRIDELPLAALILTGLTMASDEGPVVDILLAVEATVDGWLYTDRPDEHTIQVSKADLMLLVRRVQVAAELVRRGAILPGVPTVYESREASR